MITRTQVLIGLAAGIGGISPNLVTLAQGFTGGGLGIPGFLYWLGVVIFFGLGAAVALIFAETTHSKAFFLGVSLPAFIAAAQSQHGGSVPVGQPSSPTSVLFFISDSYAQQPRGLESSPNQQPRGLEWTPDQGNISDRKVTIQPMQACAKCELWFYDPSKNVVEKEYVPNLDKGIVVNVPAGATQFGIWNKEINPKLWVLPSDPTVSPKYQFGYKYKPLNDLRRGLGNNTIRPFDAELFRVDEPGPH